MYTHDTILNGSINILYHDSTKHSRSRLNFKREDIVSKNTILQTKLSQSEFQIDKHSEMNPKSRIKSEPPTIFHPLFFLSRVSSLFEGANYHACHPFCPIHPPRLPRLPFEAVTPLLLE